MSWAEVKKINSNLKRPLNEGGIIKSVYVPESTLINPSVLIPSQEVELYSCTMGDTKEFEECVFYNLPGLVFSTKDTAETNPSGYYALLIQGYVVYRIYLDDELVLMNGLNWCHKSYTEEDVANWDDPTKYYTYYSTYRKNLVMMQRTSCEFVPGCYVHMYVVNENKISYVYNDNNSHRAYILYYIGKQPAASGGTTTSFQADTCKTSSILRVDDAMNTTHPCQFTPVYLSYNDTSIPYGTSYGLTTTKNNLPFKKLTLTAELRCPVIDSSSRRLTGNWTRAKGGVSYVD